MAKAEKRKSSSTFHVELEEDTAVRKLTETGTLYTDVGNSHFYSQNQVNPRPKNTVQKKRSLTGSTVTVAGQSQFFSKPPVEELAYTPPHIVSKDVKPLRKMSRTGTIKFPQLKEFAHFHYNKVDMGPMTAHIDTEQHVEAGSNYKVVVQSSGATWVVQRNEEHFILLDRQIHYCVFDRKYSQLPDIELLLSQENQNTTSILAAYLDRFSSIAGNSINCGTVLNFFELSSSGGRLISSLSDSAINIPAVANAIVTKAYHATDFDELELKEGDLVSVIDKPPPSESSWWRGKKELTVGFFPSECVEIIGNRRSSPVTSQSSDKEQLPVLRKRDKIISFLLQFFLHRPAISQLKQSGIVKERLFGSDLGEYLTNSGQLIPKIMVCCCEAIERHGLIDGIYRLSGRVTQVQSLREEFDLDKHEYFTEDDLLDIHTVSTLLKTYFRELPNPLLTYQLYDSLVSAVQLRHPRKQVASIKAHIATLPPPHYRTAKYLFAHLARLSVYSKRTSMTSRNLAIVWAPNLISYDESAGTLNAFGVLQNVSLQAAVVDLLITNYDAIFPATSREDRLSPFDRRKPAVLSISKRLLRLSVARKKKGNVARNCNSSADYPMIHSIPLDEDSVVLRNRAVSETMSRVHSVSLDSVFTPSTMGKVHVLQGNRSKASSGRTTRSHYENVTCETQAESTLGHSSNQFTITPSTTDLHGESQPSSVPIAGQSAISKPPTSHKPTPLPKPRLNKKVHDYINLSALNSSKQDLDANASSQRQSPQSITRIAKYDLPTESRVSAVQKPLRPHTMYDPEGVFTSVPVRPYSVAIISDDPLEHRRAERQSSHYAVSTIYTGGDRSPDSSYLENNNGLVAGTPTIAETGVSKFSDQSKHRHTYTNVSIDSDTSVPRIRHRCTVGDYDNYILPEQGPGNYQNVVLASTDKSVLPNVHQPAVLSFSNPISSDQDVVLAERQDSLISVDSDSVN